MPKFKPRGWKRKAKRHNVAEQHKRFVQLVEQDLWRDLGDQITPTDRGNIAAQVVENSGGVFAGGVR